MFGGANMESAKTLDLLAEVVPQATFRGVYGSTEAGNFVTLSTGDEERERPGTIGRPLFGFDVAILGSDDQELPVGRGRRARAAGAEHDARLLAAARGLGRSAAQRVAAHG